MYGYYFSVQQVTSGLPISVSFNFLIKSFFLISKSSNDKLSGGNSSARP